MSPKLPRTRYPPAGSRHSPRSNKPSCSGFRPSAPISDDKLHRLAEAWAHKWDGRWRYHVAPDGLAHDGGTALVFAVHPSKVLAFAKGNFSHTRHRF